MGQTPTLSLSVQYASPCEGLPTRQQFRRWVQAALQQDVQCTLRIVDEEEGRKLNREFRGKDYATNVLTFVYDNTDPLSGDIVICAPVPFSLDWRAFFCVRYSKPTFNPLPAETTRFPSGVKATSYTSFVCP